MSLCKERGWCSSCLLGSFGYTIITLTRYGQFIRYVMEWMFRAAFVPHLCSHVKVLTTPSVMVLGGRAIARWDNEDGTPPPPKGISASARKGRDTKASSLCHVKTQWESCCKRGRGLLPRSKSASNLILDFLASRTRRNKCLLFNPSSLW